MIIHILGEGLEEISNSTYCTDSAADVANWIINKPKPYRVLYDSKFDIWCIADATQNTHKDMSIDIFDSGYVYDNPEHIDVDAYIDSLRKENTRYHSGWTDAEVYSDDGFDNGTLVGLFFIPEGLNYSDYEESGFYPKQTRVTTGTIFTRRSDDLPNYFTSLWRKLGLMKAFRKSLKDLWKDVKKKYDDDETYHFYDIAQKQGYTEDEVNDFFDRFGDYLYLL